jgi:hypothetical protein
LTYSSFHRELVAFPECETHDVRTNNSNEHQEDDGRSEQQLGHEERHSKTPTNERFGSLISDSAYADEFVPQGSIGVRSVGVSVLRELTCGVLTYTYALQLLAPLH